MIAYNPCEASTLPKVIKTRREPISPEQFEKLLAAIPAQHRALLQIGIETGMRWGELAALRPQHLDPVNSRISVADTIVEINKKDSPTGQRYTVKPYPKNDQHRLIKITPELTAVLQLRIASLSLRSDDLLFPSMPRDPKQPTSRNTFRTRVWRPALKAAGLPLTIRMHDLRHANASWVLAGGADLKTVMDQLGPYQITTTQQYPHTLDTAEDTALAAFLRIRKGPVALPALTPPLGEQPIPEPRRPEGPSL